MSGQPAATSKRTPGDELVFLVSAGVGSATLETCEELANTALNELQLRGALRPGGRAALLREILSGVADEQRQEAFRRRTEFTQRKAEKAVCCQVAAAAELLELTDDAVFDEFKQFRCEQIGEAWEELQQKKDNQGPAAERQLRAALWLWTKSAKTGERRQHELLDALEMAIPPYLQREQERFRALAVSYLEQPEPFSGTPPIPVPRQLPAAPRWFTGRVDELTELTAATDEAVDSGATVVISAIVGTGGIGKTALALHWAHQHVERFPDGQLFVNLRGFDPTGQPMPAATAVHGFLSAFGIDPDRIPTDLDAQVGLYRSLVAGKRMLIVLDNARDTTQVTPLLPGSPTCTVVVTSRDQLPGLITTHGAHRLALDVFEQSEAHAFLRKRLGRERQDAEPDAFAELLACCARLPLALGIVAGRATSHPDFPLAVFATELRDTATRLGALHDGDPTASLTTVLSWSYNALSPENAQVFGLLGLAPGPDIGLSATANLTGLATAQALQALRALERVSLIQQHVPGRYQMYDLVKLYAAERAVRDQPEEVHEVGLRRLVDFFLHTAHTAEQLLDPTRTPLQLDPPTPGYHPNPFHDPAAALAWLAAEHPSLLAAQRLATDHGWHRAVWQLAWTLDTFHLRRGHRDDRLAAWQTGLAAAQREGISATISVALRNLGDAYSYVGRFADALDHIGQALALAEDTGDLPSQANIHHALARTWAQQGENQRSLEHATSALHMFHDLDQPLREADLLNAVGWCWAKLGNYQQARAHCEAALILCRRHHNPEGEANTLDSLGYLAHHAGRYDEALDYYQQALALFRDLGHIYEMADTLNHIGQTYAALNDHSQAQDTWQQALRLYHEQHRTADVERIQQQLDEFAEHQREPAEAPDK